MAIIGKLSEWSKEPHSKCGVHLKCTEGSNPPLSATQKRNLSVQVYLSKQISLLCCKDAVGRLLGLRSNPPLARCQRQLVGFSRWHCLCNAGVLESLSYQICLSLFKQADSSLYFRNTYTLLPTVTYTFAIPLG